MCVTPASIWTGGINVRYWFQYYRRINIPSYRLTFLIYPFDPGLMSPLISWLFIKFGGTS